MNRRSRKNPVVTETRIRRIVQEELARQHLIKEGFLDVVKEPFKRLSEKVKEEIVTKTGEILQKLQKLLSDLQTGPIDEANEFLAALSQEPQGGSADDIISGNPSLSKVWLEIDELKEFDPEVLIASGEKSVAESITRQQLADYTLLLDEEVIQRFDSYGKHAKRPVNESVIATAFGAWWTFEKTVVGGLGLLYWGMKFLSWLTDKLGFKNASSALKKYGEKVHHLEDAIIETTAFPLPIQYAAYAAYKKLKNEKPLTFDQYKDPKNKEAKASRETVFKVLKFALLVPMLVDAAMHLVEALSGTFQSINNFAKTTKYSMKVASETGAAAKTAGTLAATAADAASVAR